MAEPDKKQNRISNEQPGETPRLQESDQVGDAEWRRVHRVDDTPHTENTDEDDESLPPQTPDNYRQTP